MNFLLSGEDKLENYGNFNIIGREEELQDIGALLIRKMSNSLILSGPAGVGLSTLCLGLQEMKKYDSTPIDVANKKLYWLDVDSLFSDHNSANVNKEFDSIINFLKGVDQSVLIIENGRNFINGVQHAGVSNFLNQLINLTRRGMAQVIFTSKTEDVPHIYNAHSDIRDQFTLMSVEEPSSDELESVVKAAHEELTRNTFGFDDNAIKVAIELTNKYRGVESLKGAQPTRTIDLLDRSLATFLSRAHATHPMIPILELKEKPDVNEIERLQKLYVSIRPQLDEIQLRIRNLQHDLLTIDDKKEEQKEETENSVQLSGPLAMFKNYTANDPETHDLKANLKKEIAVQEQKYADKLRELDDNVQIPCDFIIEEFSKISGIGSAKLNEDALEKLKELESRIKNRVFGQDHAVEALSNGVMVSTIGKRNKNKPKTAFMFMGPSGVGKTEIAKALAENLLDDESALTRFDMSEYMEKHAVAKLIGAPPGYEGYEAGGILTNLMHKNPNRIILFDEIEKADPSVFNIFLQILDDGRLTDNTGRTVSFSETIIIMTTNVGQPYFLDTSIEWQEANRLAKDDLDNEYRSEFLNRFNGRQNIVCFNRLMPEHIVKIIDRELNNLIDSYEATDIAEGIKIDFFSKDIEQFVADHYDPKVGARGLPGFISSTLEPMIVRNLMSRLGNILIRYNTETKAFEVQNV